MKFYLRRYTNLICYYNRATYATIQYRIREYYHDQDIKLNCVSNPISLKKKLRQKESHSACFAYNPTIHTTLTISNISLHKSH